VSENLILWEDPPRLTNRKTNWEVFRSDLENLIKLQIPLQTPEQLEEEVDSLIINIQQAAWNNTLPLTNREKNIH
jgi:hypothetical protein